MPTLYVTDLDGTLLNAQDRVSPRSQALLNALIAQGVCISYATARSFTSASRAAAGVAWRAPVIVYNGCQLVDPQTGARLRSQGFAPAARAQVERLAARCGLSPMVYAFVDGAERVSWDASQGNPGKARYLALRQGDPRLRPLPDGRGLYAGDVFYYTFIGAQAELSPLRQALLGVDGAAVLFQQELYRPEYFLEVLPASASKAAGLTALKALLGCRWAVCFGDAANDLPLFAAADAAYAVGNAVPALKAAATAVLPSHEQDSVARWLWAHAER